MSTKSFEQAYQSIQKLSVNNNPTTTRRRRKSKDVLPASSSNQFENEDKDEDDDQEEMEFSMGKLIRQASLNHSHPNPLNKQDVTSASSVQESGEKTRPQQLMSQLKTQKSLSALQGSKDLGGFMNLDSNSCVVSNVSNPERKLTRTQSWAPPVPLKWGGGKKSKEDIKKQIKFWARAVASNVNPQSDP